MSGQAISPDADVANRTTARPRAWRVWLLAARPATLSAGLAPVFVGTALAAAGGTLHLGGACAACGGSVCIQIGTNLFNDHADHIRGADTGARLGPARASQRGWLRPGQLLVGVAISFALATAFGLYLTALAGWPVVLLGIVSLLCGVAYTGGPFPLAYHGLGELFVVLCFGVFAVAGTYFVQAQRLSWPVFCAGIALGLLATGILVVNNLRDRRTDEAAHKRTLAVRFGALFARWEYAACVFAAYALVAAVWLLGGGSLGWLLPCLSAPLAVQHIRQVFRSDGAALNPLLGQTARLEMVFALLLSVGVLL